MHLSIQIELKKLHHSFSSIEKHFKELDPKLLYKIMLITEEILTNLARHANFQEKEPHVTLKIETSPLTQLIFQDNSKKFNILNYPTPNIEEELEKRGLGGLGIFLTKKYAQDIEYIYENGYNILKVLL